MTTPEQQFTTTQQLIYAVCNEVRDTILQKNRQYGNSALEPLRIFSKTPTFEQLNVRIDDKLSRIASAQEDDAEDPELDLIGYLILKRVYRELQRRSELT